MTWKNDLREFLMAEFPDTHEEIFPKMYDFVDAFVEHIYTDVETTVQEMVDGIRRSKK